jgi:pimeloyl-ACP methyl ester carboxylesterase
MQPTRAPAFALLAALAALCAGPARAEEPAAEPVRPGVVFVLGGVGGCDPVQTWAPVALPLAGVPHEIRVFEWTHGKFRVLRDLQDTRWLLGKAGELADAVRAVKAEDPDRPVYLLGHSAGAAVVLYAAGQLEPGALERVVLLSPAVSPTFDLRPALRATRKELVAFTSPLDLFVLCWGTSHFGTVDRYYVPAAGFDGFKTPDDLDEEGRRLYARLVQSGWRWDMCLERGFLHNGPCMPLCIGKQVAPWLVKP